MRPAFKLHQPSAAGKEKGKRSTSSPVLSSCIRTLYEMKNYLQLRQRAHTHAPVRGMCQVTWCYIDLFLLTPRPQPTHRFGPKANINFDESLHGIFWVGSMNCSRFKLQVLEKNGFIMSEIFSLLLRFFIYISAGCLAFCVPPEPRSGYEWDTN